MIIRLTMVLRILRHEIDATVLCCTSRKNFPLHWPLLLYRKTTPLEGSKKVVSKTYVISTKSDMVNRSIVEKKARSLIFAMW